MSEGVVLLSTVSADSCTLETSYFIRNEDENGLFPLLKKKSHTGRAVSPSTLLYNC